jgi:Holliday junction resolvase
MSAGKIDPVCIVRKRNDSRGGRRSRDKGNRAERALVRFLQDHGFAAERVPLSGSARGRFSGDIALPLLGIDHTVEVKCSANGFKALYAALEAASLLIVRADRREPLVILRLELAAEIAKAVEHSKGGPE